MNIENLSETIKTKSDQLNADDLIGGPIDVLITGIKSGNREQPVIIAIEGHQPFKPCKTVRRLLIKGWGDNGHDWVGKSMTLYNDPAVKWAGVAIGGIRVSHMSHISAPFDATLNASAKHKMKHTIQVLIPVDYSATIAEFAAITNQEERDHIWNTYTPQQKAAIINAPEK